MIRCCIGIMAYNEAANIGRLLEALLSQKTETVYIDKIVVVASGCSDGTEEIVNNFAARDRRIQLLVQAKREGKASAVNLFMANNHHEIIVMESADTLPLEGSIEALVSLFADPEVGMVGGHPVPVNSPDTFMGFGVNLLWELHHRVSLRHPKMGELIAFRNIFRQIPGDSAVDEASIEPLIVGQGLRLKYAPDAKVLNKGPENVKDFIKQRRRIFAGHLYVKDTLGYKVATMNGWQIAWLYLSTMKLNWRYLFLGPIFILLEIYVRILAVIDYKIYRQKPFSWSMVDSTKDLAKIS